jgi:hypothetical protein
LLSNHRLYVLNDKEKTIENIKNEISKLPFTVVINEIRVNGERCGNLVLYNILIKYKFNQLEFLLTKEVVSS